MPETVQAAYYRRALELVSCQPTAVGLPFFHVSDEVAGPPSLACRP